MDEEKNKYLIFKSISGFDAVPRIREPTPERNKKAAQEEQLMAEDPDCQKCTKFKDLYLAAKQENEELKEELVKAYELMEKERVSTKLSKIY